MIFLYPSWYCPRSNLLIANFDQIIDSAYLHKMQQEFIRDEDLEAMLSRLRISKTEMACKKGNKITRACINPECPISLICGSDECDCCGVAH